MRSIRGVEIVPHMSTFGNSKPGAFAGTKEFIHEVLKGDKRAFFLMGLTFAFGEFRDI